MDSAVRGYDPFATVSSYRQAGLKLLLNSMLSNAEKAMLHVQTVLKQCSIFEHIPATIGCRSALN